MSGRVMASALYTSGLCPSERLVLVLLADKADEDGASYYSVESMAFLLDLGERTVKAALKALERKGHIERQPRPRQTTVYRIIEANLGADNAPKPRVQKTTVKGAESCKTRVQKTTPDSPIKNPPYNPPLGDAPAAPPPDASERTPATEIATVPEPPANHPAVVPINTVQMAVWTEGLQTLIRITGMTNRAARSQIAGFLRTAKQDCTAVLAAIRDADRERPYEPVPWIHKSIQSRAWRQMSQHERIRRRGNLPTLLFTPDDPEPAPAVPSLLFGGS